MKRFPLAAAALLLAAIPGLVRAQTWNMDAVDFSRLAGFSQAMVIDGEDVIVTRTGESSLFPSPATQKGGVFVFRSGETGWRQVHEMIPADVQIGDRFGQAMALSGDWLAVSAPGASQGCGVVIVFERDRATGWTQRALLNHPGCEVDERLGWSLAFHENRLYAGAPGTRESAGAVHVFMRGEDGWMLEHSIAGPDAGSSFGESIAAGPQGLFVGAPDAEDGRGVVYVFGGFDTGGIPDTLRSGDDAAILFGLEIAAGDDAVLVAAPGMRARQNVLSQPKPGKVFVFEREDRGWLPVETIELAAESDQRNPAAFGFGSAVALGNNEAWVGAPFGGSMAGAVHVYVNGDAGWTSAQVLSTRPLSIGAGFGTQIALSDHLGVVGAIRADFGEGRGTVFRRAGDQWLEESSISDSGRGLTAITGEERACDEGSIEMFDCEKVDLLAFLPVKDVGGDRGVIVNDVWGWTDPETGNEYAIVGRSDGTSFIDVTHPTAPVFVGDLPATEGSTPNAWRDVKVYNNHAFVVADNVGKHGMQVFDLTQLRDVSDPPVTFEATAVYDKIFSAHNIVINEASGFAYIVAASGGGETCGGGYHMVDIRDPKNPVFAGCYSDPSAGAGGNHIHDAQCVIYNGPDADHQGREICFGANASVFSIADVTDKENPRTLAALDYPKVAYVHQGWLTDDQKYFYINDEGDEVGGLVDATRTLVWDVADLDDPVLVNEHLGTTQASDHNLYVKGNLMYQSNYVSGLQILDISDPLNPKEVGHFDTVPWGENAPGFAGSWSNYPYFESGTIVVTSITEGVFLVRKSKEFVQ